MSLAVSYSRVSTVLKQQQKSLQEQQEQWAEIIEKEGDTLAFCGIFYKKNGNKKQKKGMYIDEGISGKEYSHRLAFKQMVEDGLSGKFKKIYVEDCSRFARCTEDGMKIIKDLREKHVNVYFRKESLNSIDPNNDLVLTVLFAAAEKENQMRSERFKWRFNRIHQKGGWTAPRPYGYMEDPLETAKKEEDREKCTLVINEKERAVVDLIFYLYTDLRMGTRSIASHLNDKGFRTREKKKRNGKEGETEEGLWKHSSVYNVLKNEMLIGIVRNHRTESFDITRGTRKKIPKEEQVKVIREDLRIIEQERWDRKEQILKERNKKFSEGHGDSTKNLLSTVLYCNQCRLNIL